MSDLLVRRIDELLAAVPPAPWVCERQLDAGAGRSVRVQDLPCIRVAQVRRIKRADTTDVPVMTKRSALVDAAVVTEEVRDQICELIAAAPELLREAVVRILELEDEVATLIAIRDDEQDD